MLKKLWVRETSTSLEALPPCKNILFRQIENADREIFRFGFYLRFCKYVCYWDTKKTDVIHFYD